MLTTIDHLPSWTTFATSGDVVRIRPVDEDDADRLQLYFRGLSTSSRYRRFMSAVSELSPETIARIVGKGDVPTFTVVAEIASDGGPSIVGEATCALDMERRCGDLAVSVEDRWQRHGIGFALLHVMECHSARLGVQHLIGEALQTNDPVQGLARRAGFAVTRQPDEWKVVQLEKILPSAKPQQG